VRWRSRRRSTPDATEQYERARPPADDVPAEAADAADPGDAADDARRDQRVSASDEVQGPAVAGDAERLFERVDDADDDQLRSADELRSDDERAAAWLSAVADAADEADQRRAPSPAPEPPAEKPPAEEPPAPSEGGPAPEPTAWEPAEAVAQPPHPPTSASPAAAAEVSEPSGPEAPEPASAEVPEPTGPPGRVTSAPSSDAHALAAARREVVRRALDEDLALAGDVTALATVPPEATGVGRLVARARGVVAGMDAITEVYDQLDPRVEVRLRVRDGDAVEAGEVVAEVYGPLRSVLTGERTALNLLTHLSGVATVTAAYVAAVAGTGCEVRDTRKTTPGLRLLEKAAVVAGGGTNHRVGLFDALLVKENHIAAAGGVEAATRAAIAAARDLAVQVEVETLEELDEAVAAGARDVLLDNFDVATTRQAVARRRELEAVHGRILLESSGGLDLDTVAAYASAGVDRVAVGALTHSAPQLDLALEVVPSPQA
jgi:nicotinate-nucleotide pyrophosphorylase (carboxylating)